MWDGWETTRGCVRRTTAELRGYRRVFNKASVRNWGTNQKPCPTLNLEPVESAICRGIAFEFPEDMGVETLAYLAKREGQAFRLQEQPIHLDDGIQVPARVAIYSGKNTIAGCSLPQIVEMASTARGVDGTCIAYIRGISDKLAGVGNH